MLLNMVRSVDGAVPHHPEKTKVKLGAEGGRDLVLHGQTVIIVLCQIVLFLTKIFTNLGLFLLKSALIFVKSKLFKLFIDGDKMKFT